MLARAYHRCEMGGANCKGAASTVDHVIPASELAATGRLELFFDVGNLRAACTACNYSAGASHGNRTRPRRPRQSAEDMAREWAARENAYWREVERQAAAAPARTPHIY